MQVCRQADVHEQGGHDLVIGSMHGIDGLLANAAHATETNVAAGYQRCHHARTRASNHSVTDRQLLAIPCHPAFYNVVTVQLQSTVRHDLQNLRNKHVQLSMLSKQFDDCCRQQAYCACRRSQRVV